MQQLRHTADFSQDSSENYNNSEESNESSAQHNLKVPIIPFLQSSQRKVKVDQGFKIKLRADRESIFELFKALGFGRGIHHWSYDRWLNDVTGFTQHPHFKGVVFSTEEIHGLILLLYPSFGETKTKGPRPEVFRGLGKTQGGRKTKLDLYHGIFRNNNKKLRAKFYSDSLIKKLYPHMLPLMTKEVVFGKKGPNMAVQKSYCEVTRQMQEVHKLGVPKWWAESFPPQ